MSYSKKEKKLSKEHFIHVVKSVYAIKTLFVTIHG